MTMKETAISSSERDMVVKISPLLLVGWRLPVVQLVTDAPLEGDAKE